MWHMKSISCVSMVHSAPPHWRSMIFYSYFCWPQFLPHLIPRALIGVHGCGNPLKFNYFSFVMGNFFPSGHCTLDPCYACFGLVMEIWCIGGPKACLVIIHLFSQKHELGQGQTMKKRGRQYFGSTYNNIYVHI
jgi:hypothetical protein